MKKIIAGLAAIIMAAAMFSITALGQTEIQLKLTPSQTMLGAGNELTITVSMENYSDTAIPNIMGIQINLPIDQEYFEFVSGSGRILLPADVRDEAELAYAAIDGVKFLYMHMEPDYPLSRNTKDIFSFRVRLRKNIPDGTTRTFTCDALAAINGDEGVPVVVEPAVVSHDPDAPPPPPVTSQNNQPPGGGGPVIHNPDNKPIDIIYNEDGTITLIGDDLSGISVEYVRDGETTTVTFDDDNNNVILRDDDDGVVAFNPQGEVIEKFIYITMPASKWPIIISAAVLLAAITFFAVTIIIIITKKKSGNTISAQDVNVDKKDDESDEAESPEVE
ncbi:MAG: hypothetical protein FWH14_03035 [Oscillospiraceae bacterium]|nr:hypothetical protein [Oscillospiraceae bacterium]